MGRRTEVIETVFIKTVVLNWFHFRTQILYWTSSAGDPTQDQNCLKDTFLHISTNKFP